LDRILHYWNSWSAEKGFKTRANERERERERENNTKCQWIVSKWREITTRKKEEVWMLPQ